MAHKLLLAIASLALPGVAALASALWLGGPGPVAPLDSINAPFAEVDFSALPAPQHATARDGVALAYRAYPPTAAPNGTRVVLLHGSSADSRSMHPLAQALAAAGFAVQSLDVRGHGGSGQRGHIGYIGQLEDDLEDFVRATPWQGRTMLLGLSAGGGFALRFAADARAGLFSRYVLLAPFIGQDAPTARPGLDGWVSVGVPRIVALMVLNRLGVTGLNHLPVTEFGLNEAAQRMLTPRYDFNLATNYRPRLDYMADLRAVRQPVQVLVGSDDELFLPDQFAPLLAAAGVPATVTVVPGANHIGVSLAPAALQSVVQACQ
ncbi:alpha/beta fold hydrolase [Ottowia sp.]|uniref:alpha/beta hydrolase n=1 Tax=Ottowia sp. TaxID=1898956 RepID=UPI002B691A5E|nr:alpha/beta fold hydrolase [Ottowia sp.]HOB65885.1 alpha/beta fold hydrolase [Ottowia sp.]HPZ56868.1 alpha/beta fold hydrolase [Ottowia sp.]HQD47279.1 alpha/beta fold hydrolase [Ottowia sp.]